LIVQNHLYLRQQGDFSGVNEPPEGGEEAAQEQAAKARSSFTQSFLGEEWVEVEPSRGSTTTSPGRCFEPLTLRRTNRRSTKPLAGEP
jgi:hypothetical protein